MKRDLEKFNQARILRHEGKSIREIVRLLSISSSSASIWCKDIELTESQRTRLASKGKSVEILRAFAAKRQADRLANNSKLFSEAKDGIKEVNNNELFLLGVALYWAEGFKSLREQQVGFCNSDPRMIRFMMRWFREALGIPDQDFVFRAEFNISHLARREEIEAYWSNVVGIPKSQFNRPYLQTAKFLRDYSDKGNYYGLLRIRIRKSSQLLVKLRGWIEGLSQI